MIDTILTVFCIHDEVGKRLTPGYRFPALKAYDRRNIAGMGVTDEKNEEKL